MLIKHLPAALLSICIRKPLKISSARGLVGRQEHTVSKMLCLAMTHAGQEQTIMHLYSSNGQET